MAVRYVSNTAVNGIPVGVNSGAGGIGAPWLTVDYAIANATSGDTIMLNDGSYAANTTYAISTKSLTFLPVVDYMATLTASLGASAAQVLHFSFSGGTLTLGKIILDGNATGTFPTNNGLTITDTAAKVTVNLNGTRIQNYVQNAVQATGTATKVDFTANGVEIIGSTAAAGSRGGYFFNGVIEGTLQWIDGAITISKKSTATYGAIYLLARASGVVASVSNVTVALTLLTGLTGTSMHYGFRIWNIANVIIQDCEITLDGNGTTRNGAPIWVSANTASPAVDSGGAIIRRNTISAFIAGGYGIVNGQDGSFATADGLADNCVIEDNVIIGNAASESSVHAILAGFCDAPTIRRNKMSRFGIGVICKDTNGGKVEANIATMITGQAFRSKGATNVEFNNNTSVFPSSTYQNGYSLYNDIDAVTGVSATGTVFRNNLCVNFVSTAGYFYNDSTSDATFENNNYVTLGASDPTNGWSYRGSTYATLALWAAAREATAMAVNPRFANAANEDFYVRNPRLARAGVAVSGLTSDYYGRAFLNPPSVGAIQSRAAFG